MATELIGRAGFDWVIIDLEHGAGTESDLLANLHALGATTTAALVRPQSGERLRIGRALDLGAHGIMVPRVDRPDQAREAISFMRYPPDGGRGLALSTRGAGLGELGHTRRPGDQPADPRDHPDRIAQRGRARRRRSPPSTASTSCSSGRPTCRTASASPAGSTILATSPRSNGSTTAAEAAGKAAGILLRDASALPRHRELGFRFIGLGSDGAFITDGARAVLAAARA